jgi:hypothetical protein
MPSQEHLGFLIPVKLLDSYQLRSYLKASGCKTGLLVNFAGDRADFRRVDL